MHLKRRKLSQGESKHDMTRQIYLDNAATTPVCAAARRALFLLGGKAREPLPYAIPHRDDWKHNLFLVDKVRPTPKTYPRKAGTPTRNPL